MYHFFVWLFQPVTIAWLLLTLGVFALWRGGAARKWRWSLAGGWLLLTLLMLPGVAYLLASSLERQFPPLASPLDEMQAIVVLGGGNRLAGNDLPEELSDNSLQRCRRAAELYHLHSCPMLVCGAEEAAGMRRELIARGVPGDKVSEDNASESTHENAVAAAHWLDQRQLKTVLLVTDAAHLPRAVRVFRHQGVEVVPAGCNYQARRARNPLNYFLPGPHAAASSTDSLHEWLGLGWYWLRGRI